MSRSPKPPGKPVRQGDRRAAQQFNAQAQRIPSRDPQDPHFRRLWYCRYADDFLLGFVGTQAEAQTIKQQLNDFLKHELGLELSATKTLITHARTETARFLGYELHTLQADDKHDYRGQRCINGGIGLRIPKDVIRSKCEPYLKHGQPIHLPQRMNDSVYSIITQYQAEYVGLVQYYKLAYNLHQLNQLKWVMERSLVKTLAAKSKTSCAKIYQRYRAIHQTPQGPYKVLQVTIPREAGKPPLIARFGGVPLRWNKWVKIEDPVKPIWNKRSEIVDRLLAQRCEICGATNNIEVHHIRKLADLNKTSHREQPEWARRMAARRRKTLVVCQHCHNKIHAGQYDGPALLK